MAYQDKFRDTKPKHRVIDTHGLLGRRLLADRIFECLVDDSDPCETMFIGGFQDPMDYTPQMLNAVARRLGFPKYDPKDEEQKVIAAHVCFPAACLVNPYDKEERLGPVLDYRGREVKPSLSSRAHALQIAELLNSPKSEIRNVVVFDYEEKYVELMLSKVWSAPIDVYVCDWTVDEPEGMFPRGEAAAESWRDGCKSFGQLSSEQPKYLLDKLVPEKALTLIPAASYNCKTWFTVAMCDAISRGRDLWCFKGPSTPVPVIYHVPEMNESLVRHYMATVGVEDSENFLVRPMESGLWALDDARMLESANGRLVVLDTAGYFNPADDSSSYQQSLRFATLVYNLMVAGGAVGVVGLYHPPKYSKEESSWTLENSVLGSAGYGGILRSCLRMANLNPDLNDPNVWVYVQGLKNPGLKPFQLCGPMPLKMKVPPGQSPYLSALQSGDSKYSEAASMFEQKIPQRQVAEQLNLSLGKVNKMHKEWEASKDF